LGIMM